MSVSLKTTGNVGYIILERPEALNALSLPMIRTITQALMEWKDQDSIKAVVVKSSVERVFCAGGDIKSLYHKILKQDWSFIDTFFFEEYSLYGIIAQYPKPYISLLNGLTLGGGMGLAMHGSFCITTDQASFGMPENKIGFFPDVGAGLFLRKMPGYTGLFTGVTGYILNPQEALETGLVSHGILAQDLDAFEESLLTLDFNGHDPFDVLENHISSFQVSSYDMPSSLFTYKKDINTFFMHSTIEEVLQSLQQSTIPWWQDQYQRLETAAPLSVQATFTMLKEYYPNSLARAIQQDLKLSWYFVRHPNFLEGVRAKIIDKDNHPTWKSTTLKAVPDQEVKALFAS